MITIKRNISVRIEKRKKKGKMITENVPIFFRLTYKGNRINLYTGFRVNLEDWDEDKQQVKAKRINDNLQKSEYINTILKKYSSELNASFFKYEAKDTVPTPDEIKEIFENIRGIEKNERKDSGVNFFQVFDDFILKRGRLNNWTPRTVAKYEGLKARLEEFKKDITFDYLNEDGLIELLLFFSKKVKLRNVTIIKHFKFLKTFLRFAVDEGHTEMTDFEKFKPKLKKTKKKVIYFTEDELTKIIETNIPSNKQYLERVRDVLLFLCYSGLRHSDVYKLKKSDIKNSKIEITTQKTNDSLIIELNDMTSSILKKYQDVPLKNNKALPVISNQKMNVYLKELAKLAEINEIITETYYKGNKRIESTNFKYDLVTTHIGRRTFICLCISKEIPIQIIMKWTGHSDYQAMIPYIEVAGKTKEIQMQKLNL